MAEGRARVGVRHWWVTGFKIALVVVLAAAAGIVAFWVRDAQYVAEAPPSRSPGPAVTPSPDPAPASTTPTTIDLSPAAQLLAGTSVDDACAVTLMAGGTEASAVLQTTGDLYRALPIPQRTGLAFAGWYATPAAAAGYDQSQRINGSDLVECVDRTRTLYGSWMTTDAAASTQTAVPILMYHQFTQRPEGEDHWLRLNFAYVGDWDAHLRYISESGFYLPTWDELSTFIDGRLYLPPRSVIVTDDDADATWLEWAVPIAAQHRVLTTSFVITSAGAGPELTPYVLKRSHTHDMHSAGANGRGRIVNWDADQIVADLETSAAALGGVKEVMAYPFGHYDERAKQAVAAAGFGLARTIEQGYVRPGTDKLALPCIRINYGMTVDDLARLIG